MIDLFDFDPYHQRAGVGIIIHSKYREKGYAYEALSIFLEYCFNNLALNQLYANIMDSNEASKQLFEKAGFKPVGIKRAWIKTKDGFQDEVLYQRLKNSANL